MPTDITDVPQWVNTLVVPANGDPVDGPGWEVHGQGVGDRTSYLYQLSDYATYLLDDGPVDNLDPWPLTLGSEAGGFSLATTEVEVPHAGVYDLHVEGSFTSATVTDPMNFNILLQVAGATIGIGTAQRVGTSGPRYLSARRIATIAVPGTDVIRVVCNTNASLATGGAGGTLKARLHIRRVR